VVIFTRELVVSFHCKSIARELIAKGYVPYDKISLYTVQRFIS